MMKKLYFVLFIVITFAASAAVYGKEEKRESKGEIKITIEQMKGLLSTLKDKDLQDEKTKELKDQIKNYIEEAKNCLENYTDECHETLSVKANHLVEVKFKGYRDHYKK